MATNGQFLQIGPYFSGGELVEGVKVYTYSAGTTTQKAVYTDRAKTTAAANPVVGDANGIAAFYGDGLYKFVVTDQDDSVLYTYDNINLSDAVLQGKGATLTAASTLVLGTDGDYFQVSGSTGISGLSGTQSYVTLEFQAALTLTNSGTFILQGSRNYITRPGDVLGFVQDGTGIWREIYRLMAAPPFPLDGAKGLRISPAVGVQGSWTNSNTTFTPATGTITLLTTSNNDGYIISNSAPFYSVNELIFGQGTPTTVAWEYWNGSAWTSFSPSSGGGNTQTANRGWALTRWTSGLVSGWAVGGSGTGVPQTSYNIRVRATTSGLGSPVTGRISIATSLDVTADEVIASDTAGNKARTSSFSVTINALVNGANGLDTGSLGATTVYYAWAIYNANSQTWAGLLTTQTTLASLLATMPSGYTYGVMLGGFRTDSNSILLPWHQVGNRIAYTAGFTDLNAGTASIGTPVTLTVPAIAAAASLILEAIASAADTAQIGVSSWPINTPALSSSPEGVYHISSGASAITAIQKTIIPLPIAQTVYYSVTSGVTATIFTWGYLMPGNIN